MFGLDLGDLRVRIVGEVDQALKSFDRVANHAHRMARTVDRAVRAASRAMDSAGGSARALESNVSRAFSREVTAAGRDFTRAIERLPTPMKLTQREIKAIAQETGFYTVTQARATQAIRAAERASAGARRQYAGMRTDVAALAAPLAALAAVGRSIQLAAELERTQVAFRVIIGDAGKAAKLLEDLQQFAIETPFQETELTNATRQLLAFGFEAENVLPTLRQLGDLSAGLSIPLGDLAYLFGTSRVQGRLFAQDLNQFVGRGIPITEELAKQFGVAESEVRKLVETGQVHFTHLEQAIASMTAEGGKFHNLMEELSGTTAGRFTTAMDKLNKQLRDLGTKILPAANAAIDAIGPLIEGMGMAFQGVANAITAVGRAFAAHFSGIIEWLDSLNEGNRLLKVFGAVLTGLIGVWGAYRVAVFAAAKAKSALLALSGPRGWAVLAGAVAATTAAFVALDAAESKAAEAVMKANAAANEQARAAEKQAAAINKVADAAERVGRQPSFRMQNLQIHAEAQGLNLPQLIRDLETEAMPPFVKFQRHVLLLQDMLQQGLLGWEAYATGVEKAREALDSATGGSKQFIADLERQIAVIHIGEEAVRRIEMERAGAGQDDLERIDALQAELAALDEQEKAYQRMQDRMQAMESEAKSITEALRTPEEILAQELRRIDDLFNAGFLAAETANRAVEKAHEQFREATTAMDQEQAPQPFKLAGAFARGSAEAYSTITNAMIERSTAQERIADTTTKQLAVQIKTEETLNKIWQEQQKGPTVKVVGLKK